MQPDELLPSEFLRRVVYYVILMITDNQAEGRVGSHGFEISRVGSGHAREILVTSRIGSP